jgi:hypothetical protein
MTYREAWMGETALECSECGATLRFEGVRTAKCPYCASPSVLERPARDDLPNPDFVVAFVLDQRAAIAKAKAWQRSRGPFTHGGIKDASLDDVKGIYLPSYLYGALARASYSAQIGENYQETETYTTVENGKTVTRTRTVTKTEWRSLRGDWASYVRDVFVSASRGLSHEELDHVEPFDLRALRRYTLGQVQGWIAEEPSLDEASCRARARAEASRDVADALGRFMPGDSYRGLQYELQVEREIASLVLVPVWVLAVRYAPDKPLVRLLINGQTGKAFGKAPISWVRVTLAVLLGLALIAGLVLLGERGGR